MPVQVSFARSRLWTMWTRARLRSRSRRHETRFPSTLALKTYIYTDIDALFFVSFHRQHNLCAGIIRMDAASARRADSITARAPNSRRRKLGKTQCRKCSTTRKRCTAWVTSVHMGR